MHTQHVQVVIPARDEEELLPAALRAVRASLRHAESALAGNGFPHSLGCGCRPPVSGGWSPRRLEARLTVVADLCTDRTVEVAVKLADHVIESSSGSAGAARSEGYPLPGEGLLLCTDADSVVPRGWVLEHLRHYWAGADAVAGAVKVRDWSPHTDALRRAYEQKYADERDHVHGANLSVTPAAYEAVGGFAALDVGEDRDLVQRLRNAGFCVHECTDMPVTTSARRKSRVTGGFADHLNALQETL